MTTWSAISRRLPIAVCKLERVAVGLPVNLLLDWDAVATNSALNVVHYAAAKKGAAAGSVGYSFGANPPASGVPERVTIEDDPFTPRRGFACPGTNKTSYIKSLVWDLTGRDGSDGKYEGILENSPFPAGVLDCVINFDLVPNPLPDTGGEDGGIDLVTLYSGTSYAVAHLAVPFYVDVNSAAPGSGGFLCSHGQVAANSNKGQFIPLIAGHRYKCALFNNSADQQAEVIVQDATTGELVGSSFSPSDLGEVTQFIIHDYAVAHGGSFKLANIAAAWGSNLLFPLDDTFEMPPVGDLSAVQTGQSEITIAWTANSTPGVSSLQRFLIQKRVNGGDWTSRPLQWQDEYVDTEVEDGDVVDYRVSAAVGTHTSVPGVTAETVDNSSFQLFHKDDFGRSADLNAPADTDVNDGDLGWNYFKYPNGGSLLSISGGAYGVGGNAFARWDGTFFQANQFVSVKMNAAGAGGPMARLQPGSAAAGYLCFPEWNGISHVVARIYKVSESGGVISKVKMGADLHSGDIWATNDYIGLHVTDDGSAVTLRCYRNPSFDAEGRVTSLGTQVGTDRTDALSPYLSGQPGFFALDSNVVDNLRANEV